MTSWVSHSSAGKFSQAEKLQEGEEDFPGDFPGGLEGLADSLDNGSRLYHCSPGPCDANNNNVKMRDPLLCLGSVPTLMNQPTTCVDDHMDKTSIVYHTLASQSSQPASIPVTNSAQASSITQSDWSNIITTINFGQFYDTPFQYVLNAATTPCSKINDESLTYLNQGQSYELKLKKIGEASYTEQYFMSIVRVIFHERRLQYMEKEQLDTWKQTRPGERILDIDIPLSYGLVDVKIDPEQLSCLHFVWDSNRDSSGVYIKLNAISTEFTAKRHGGEKGVPFRVQVETYALPTAYVQPHSSSSSGFSNFSDISTKLVHCASCQVKVFKPKGADRKYKTDREKIDKKSESEKEKYQPAFDYTVLSEIPLEQVRSYLEQQIGLNKPSVSSTSVDCGVPSPVPHFQMKPANQSQGQGQGHGQGQGQGQVQGQGQGQGQGQLFHAGHDAFFASSHCGEAAVMGSASYHVMNPAAMGVARGTPLHLDDGVFGDHSGVLQSSINDFQRIQLMYNSGISDSGSESGFLNCFGSYGEVHKPPSPARHRTAERLHEGNECTVSVISPALDPTSPAGGEVKRVIYGPYGTSRMVQGSSLHGGAAQLHSQARSPASPDRKKEEDFKTSSLPSSPLLASKPDEVQNGHPRLDQGQAPKQEPHQQQHPSRCHSVGSLSPSNLPDCLDPGMDSSGVEGWLLRNRFENCVQHFNEFTGADLLRLSREDLIQICGTVNGIRLNNALHSKPIRPKLTLYVVAVGKLAEAKETTTEDGSASLSRSFPQTGQRHTLERSDSLPADQGLSGSKPEDGQRSSRRAAKRSRSPESRPTETAVGVISRDGEGVDSAVVENQSKKYKGGPGPFEGDVENDVHAVYMEVVSVENLVRKLSSIFLIDPGQVRSVHLRRGAERVNVVVSDSVIQNLADGLKLGVDIKDYVPGSMSLQLISWE